jgi:hypothetical protein
MTIVVDSNGLSKIVGFCLLTSEDQENVSDMASTFKKHNHQWKNIKCIMADKDFTERTVFKQQFPGSQILICIFHCLRSMSREITSEKMKIISGKTYLKNLNALVLMNFVCRRKSYVLGNNTKHCLCKKCNSL